MEITIGVMSGVLILFLLGRWRKSRAAKRQALIDNYEFPAAIKQKVKEKYQHLTDPQLDQVILGLREYFHLCSRAGRRMVAMPSQVVDVAWHEFILFTRNYEQFCRMALGRFLHHTPAEAMRSPKSARIGIKRAWQFSCRRERINQNRPLRLPLLFAMDRDLNITDGFIYTTDCNKSGQKSGVVSAKAGAAAVGVVYCAAHIDGGSNVFWGVDSSDSGDSGDGGCGGGCGGD